MNKIYKHIPDNKILLSFKNRCLVKWRQYIIDFELDKEMEETGDFAEW